MGSVVTFVVVVTLALLVVRIATVALTLTGLSRDMASFQARSAYTGVGFTTAESEAVVSDPRRRRIMKILMLLGHAGLVTSASTLIIGFSDSNPEYSLRIRLATLLTGLIALWGVAYSKTVDKMIFHVAAWGLRRFTTLTVKDFTTFLELPDGYAVVELRVSNESSLVNRKLRDLELRQKGLNIMCIKRGHGEFIGDIGGATEILANDQVMLYARKTAIKNLARLAHPDSLLK